MICNAAVLMMQLAAASGGAAWNSVGEVSASGHVTSAGLRGTAQLDSDVRGGRYAALYRIQAGIHEVS